jgi:hypothetical protein
LAEENVEGQLVHSIVVLEYELPALAKRLSLCSAQHAYASNQLSYMSFRSIVQPMQRKIT